MKIEINDTRGVFLTQKSRSFCFIIIRERFPENIRHVRSQQNYFVKARTGHDRTKAKTLRIGQTESALVESQSRGRH